MKAGVTGFCEGTAGSEDEEFTVVYTWSLETCKDTLIATDTCGAVRHNALSLSFHFHQFTGWALWEVTLRRVARFRHSAREEYAHIYAYLQIDKT